MHDRYEAIPVRELVAGGALHITDGHRMRNLELAPSGIPFVRGADIGDGNINTSTQDHIAITFADRIQKKLSHPGDVAFITKGTVGRVGFLRTDQPQVVFAPQVCCWRALDLEVLEPRFVFYLLKGPQFQANLDAVKTHGSMVADYVSITDQMSFRLTIPPINQQRAIANVLGALDDKIESNRRMNETLEALAGAIFESWFVKFDPVCAKAAGKTPLGLDTSIASLFPDHFQNSVLGQIPAGWTCGSLGRCKYTRILPSGISSFAGKKTYFATADVHRGRLIGEGENVDFANRRSRANMQPEVDTVWFAKMKDSPKHFLINQSSAWIAERAIFSTGFTGLRCLSESSPFVYSFISSADFDTQKNSLSIGTTMQAVNNELIPKLWILNPPTEIVSSFAHIVGPLYERFAQNENESRSLAGVRDALLPKLLSGAIRIETTH